ncbi:hypothetical protein K435DRAFT_649277, partial [Dendrothele bispora CBS 962.96]
IDAAELSRSTRFAAKGGMRKCTATYGCVAEGNEDLVVRTLLVILDGSDRTVLMQIPTWTGYCEGTVGRFQA